MRRQTPHCVRAHARNQQPAINILCQCIALLELPVSRNDQFCAGQYRNKPMRRANTASVHTTRQPHVTV